MCLKTMFEKLAKTNQPKSVKLEILYKYHKELQVKKEYYLIKHLLGV